VPTSWKVATCRPGARGEVLAAVEAAVVEHHVGAVHRLPKLSTTCTRTVPSGIIWTSSCSSGSPLQTARRGGARGERAGGAGHGAARRPRWRRSRSRGRDHAVEAVGAAERRAITWSSCDITAFAFGKAPFGAPAVSTVPNPPSCSGQVERHICPRRDLAARRRPPAPPGSRVVRLNLPVGCRRKSEGATLALRAAVGGERRQRLRLQGHPGPARHPDVRSRLVEVPLHPRRAPRGRWCRHLLVVARDGEAIEPPLRPVRGRRRSGRSRRAAGAEGEAPVVIRVSRCRRARSARASPRPSARRAVDRAQTWPEILPVSSRRMTVPVFSSLRGSPRPSSASRPPSAGARAASVAVPGEDVGTGRSRVASALTVAAVGSGSRCSVTTAPGNPGAAVS